MQTSEMLRNMRGCPRLPSAWNGAIKASQSAYPSAPVLVSLLRTSQFGGACKHTHRLSIISWTRASAGLRHRQFRQEAGGQRRVWKDALARILEGEQGQPVVLGARRHRRPVSALRAT